METGPFEIERKYLIRRPSEVFLQTAAECSEIVQTYLVTPKEGGRARVRLRRWGNKVSYTHTVKRRVNDLRAIELEREISESEYRQLLEQADPKRETLQKLRYCLPYREQLFEIDIYPFWPDQAIMEIELADESQPVELPPEIEILREVSADRKFSNAALAKWLAEEKMEQ